MNERIKELSRQAVISMRAEKTDLPPLEENVIKKILELREEYDKKFSELIVKECVSVCNGLGDWCDPGTTAEQIKKHFGVEE